MGAETPFTSFDEIKKRVIIAMFSDDRFMQQLVLKGGNALDLVHRVSTRASVDIDLSMENDFDASERPLVQARVEKLLTDAFKPAFVVFDLKMEERPPEVTPDMADFWGGYRIEFKLAQKAVFDRFSTDHEQLRRNAIMLGHSSKFMIDISKFEYTVGKQREYIDSYLIFVYSPAMIVAEKLRAICQQMPEYDSVVRRSRAGAPRARDFVDIHALLNSKTIDVQLNQNLSLIEHMFSAKRVPLSLLGNIRNQKEFHRSDFRIVEDTVRPGHDLKSFDYYFDFVVSLTDQLESLWNS